MNRNPGLNQRVVKFDLFLLILAACWSLGRIFKVDIAYYQSLLAQYPLALSGLIFVLLYVVTTTVVWLGPKDVLRISGAILFGATVSTIFVWVSEMLNSVIMFHLSRLLGREFVQKKFKVESKDLDKMKDDASLLSVIAWRINPLIPFRLMDLGYGLTHISFRKYFLGIAVISFFRILWLQSILAGIGVSLFHNIRAMADYYIDHPVVLRYSVIYFLSVLLVTVAAIIARHLRRKNLKFKSGQ